MNSLEPTNESSKIVKISAVKPCAYSDSQLKMGREILSVDPTCFRPTEVDLLIGDPAKEELGWIPEYNLEGLVTDMMQNDL